ncbi:MAG TPA: response regulator, partial [Myxococcota bacterium]|nr:response regulator [Myxococcota bacterium]
MRALLVDDERLARRELRGLLAEHADVEVIAEADCVDVAERVVHSERPDVIFLDVQLTYESGFDLLARLESAPRVVFVTAYDRH